MLGKRKRDTQVVSKRNDETETYTSETYTTIDPNHDIFRRHFEATFAPLPEQRKDKDTSKDGEATQDSEAESEVSEWSGLSESSEHLPVVEVVDHASTEENGSDEFHRSRQKSFMSSRPPREVDATAGTKIAKPDEDDDPTEKLNLKHDLDLQRLLKESHLLERSRASTTPGKERQLALDMRLQVLGAKTSIFTQEKMPKSHRVGITKKTDLKEAMRRKDATENGVVLEKATSKKKNTSNIRRDRGVDVPGVGKFSGGTLKLSRRDIASIQGPGSGSMVGRRKGRRR